MFLEGEIQLPISGDNQFDGFGRATLEGFGQNLQNARDLTGKNCQVQTKPAGGSLTIKGSRVSVNKVFDHSRKSRSSFDVSRLWIVNNFQKIEKISLTSCTTGTTESQRLPSLTQPSPSASLPSLQSFSRSGRYPLRQIVRDRMGSYI